MSDKILVLLSGGMDSVYCAQKALTDGRLAACLFIDWGHPAKKQEKKAAQDWCDVYGVPMVCRSIDLDTAPMDEDCSQASRYVPSRNLAFISLAANVAKSIGAGVIWYGATYDDRHDYPDCTAAWVSRVNLVLAVEGLRLEAPAIKMTKTQIAQIVNDPENTFSCYQPANGQHCDNCKSCQARKNALDLRWEENQ